MSMRMSADDQFKFLLSCVKWSMNGKVDFSEVAAECGVVSKGAAAKRYERMLKNHGIHPNGGPLEHSPVPKEKSIGTPKVSRKRKQDQSTSSIKQDEDEERKPPLSKRPRIGQQHEMKQEHPPIAYPPYMYHPVMPPHGQYMPRHMSPFVQSGIPHQMQHHSSAMQPSFPLMSGMNGSHQFMMPQQMQPFQMNQNMAPLGQEPNSLNSFEEFCNQDFGNTNFESLLHGDAAVTHSSNDFSHLEKSNLVQEEQQKLATPVSDIPGRIKEESSQSWNESLLDRKPSNEPEIPPCAQDHGTAATFELSNMEVDAPATTANIVAEAAPAVTESERLLPLKRENDGCIFITD